MKTLAISRDNPLFRPRAVRLGRLSAQGEIMGHEAGLCHSRTLAENADHVFSGGTSERMPASVKEKAL